MWSDLKLAFEQGCKDWSLDRTVSIGIPTHAIFDRLGRDVANLEYGPCARFYLAGYASKVIGEGAEMTPLYRARAAMRAFRREGSRPEAITPERRATIAVLAAEAATALEEAGYPVDAAWMRSDAHWWRTGEVLESTNPDALPSGDEAFYGLSEEEWPT